MYLYTVVLAPEFQKEPKKFSSRGSKPEKRVSKGTSARGQKVKAPKSDAFKKKKSNHNAS